MSEKKPPRWRVILRVAIAVAVTIAVIVGLVQSVAGAGEMKDIFLSADWRFAALAMTVSAINVGMSAVRWRFVLSAMGHRVPYGRTLYAVLATWPLAVVLPSRAGDFFRAGFVRDHVPLMAGAGSVLAEKLVDVQTLGLMALVGCVLHGNYEWAAMAAGLLIAEWTGIALLLILRERVKRFPLVRRKPERVDQLLAAIDGLRQRPRYLVALFATSLGAWFGSSLMVFFLVQATGTHLALGTVISLFPLAVFAGLLPITLAGVGTRDAMFLFLLQVTGHEVDGPRIVAATLLYALLGTWVPALAGVPLFLRSGVTRP